MGRWTEQSLQETFVVACEEAWLECEKGEPSASGMQSWWDLLKRIPKG